MHKWEIIDGFSTPGEYAKFISWVAIDLQSGTAKKVPVEDSYGAFGFDEEWYEHVPSGEIWRLVAPQAPFRGYWGPVNKIAD